MTRQTPKRQPCEPLTALIASRGPLAVVDKAAYGNLKPAAQERLDAAADDVAREGDDDVLTSLTAYRAKAPKVAPQEPLDPLPATLAAARALPWWEPKVEAKAVLVPVNVWARFLEADEGNRKRLLTALSKYRYAIKTDRTEERKRRTAQEKVQRADERPAKLAAVTAELASLRIEEDQYRRIMEDCVAHLPEKDRPPAVKAPWFGGKNQALGERYRAAQRALVVNLDRATGLQRASSGLRRALTGTA